MDNNKTPAVTAMSFARVELPAMREVATKGWATWGSDNLLPRDIMRAFDGSAVHAAIVKSKQQWIAGGGIGIEGMTPKETEEWLGSAEASTAAELRRLLYSPNPDETLADVAAKAALDWVLFGAIALEVTWARDGRSIGRIKHVPSMRVRSGLLDEDGRVSEYYYSRDWSRATHKGFTPVRVPGFDRGMKEECPVQLLFVRDERPDLDYHATPSWWSAMQWVTLDAEMGGFFSSLIQNGFSPSFVAKFYGQATPEQQQTITQLLRSQYSGSSNAGKMIVTFADSKELSPEFQPIETSNLDKQYIALSELVIQNIIVAHRVPSPSLVGLAIPGKLGYSNEVQNSAELFQRTVIGPDQRVIERAINRIMRAGGVYREFTLTKFNPEGK